MHRDTALHAIQRYDRTSSSIAGPCWKEIYSTVHMISASSNSEATASCMLAKAGAPITQQQLQRPICGEPSRPPFIHFLASRVAPTTALRGAGFRLTQSQSRHGIQRPRLLLGLHIEVPLFRLLQTGPGTSLAPLEVMGPWTSTAQKDGAQLFGGVVESE